MNHLLCMIKILFPLVYVSIQNAKTTIKNWKKTTNPKPTKSIKSSMARRFTAYLHRMAQPFAAAALIVQQAAMLRPCEVIDLTRNDIRLAGDIELTGARSRVAGLVITNVKTAKKGNPQVAIIKDAVAVEVL